MIYTQSGYLAQEFAHRSQGGQVGINVGIPVPLGVFGFTGHKNSFFGDLHTMGADGIRFFTEQKTVTAHWFSEQEVRAGLVGAAVRKNTYAPPAFSVSASSRRIRSKCASCRLRARDRSADLNPSRISWWSAAISPLSRMAM